MQKNGVFKNRFLGERGLGGECRGLDRGRGRGGGNLQTARSRGKEEVRGSVTQTRLHAEVLAVVVCHQSTRM